MLRKAYLRLRGYKIHVPFTHPLQDRAHRLQGRRRAYLDAQIAKYREHFHAKRAVVQPKPDYRVGSMDVEKRLNRTIEGCWLAVDRAFYRAGL